MTQVPNAVSSTSTCTQPANVTAIAKPNFLCRSMKPQEVKKIFEELIIRDITPAQLASMAEFDSLAPDIKKLVKAMNAEMKANVKAVSSVNVKTLSKVNAKGKIK
jgi:hypothetical protein